MYSVDLLVEGHPVESITAQDVVDLKARLEKLERVAEAAQALDTYEDFCRSESTFCDNCAPDDPAEWIAARQALYGALAALDGDGNG